MSSYGNAWIHTPELTLNVESFMEAIEDYNKDVSDTIWEYQLIEDKRAVDYTEGDEKLSGRGEIYMDTLIQWLEDLKDEFNLQIAIAKTDASEKLIIEVGFGRDVSEDEYNDVVNTAHTPDYEDLENMINSGVYWFEESNTKKMEEIFLN